MFHPLSEASENKGDDVDKSSSTRGNLGDEDVWRSCPVKLRVAEEAEPIGISEISEDTHKLMSQTYDPYSSAKTQQLSTKTTSWCNPLPFTSSFESFSIDSTNFDIGVEAARPLKRVPEYFMKNSAFISYSAHEDVLKDLNAVLEANDDVDHEFCVQKNKLHGIIRSACGGRVRFCIKIYSMSESEIMIEFHRREGCAVLFNQLYRTSVSQIPQHFERRATSPDGMKEEFVCNSMTQLPVLDLPPLDDEVETEHDAMMKDLCVRLCEEATSKYLDVQREAMRELVELTHGQDQEGSVRLGVDQAVALLQKALLSSDTIVQERACMLLVNVCVEGSARCDIVERLLKTLFEVLDSPGSLEKRCMKRCIAHSFAILSSCPKAVQMMKEHCLKEKMATLKKYSQYNDNRLKEHITTALQQIEAA